MKTCSKCKKDKVLSDFGPRPDSKDGLMGQCHECRNEYLKERRKNSPGVDRGKWKRWASKNREYNNKRVKKYYNDNIEKMRKQSNRYAKEHREERQLYSRVSTMTFKGRRRNWKAAAKSRGIDWNVADDFLLSLPMTCFYTGHELTWEHNKFNTISLDRKDSSKGYTPDNVVFCCSIINKMKWQNSVEDFVMLCGKVWNNKENILKQK